MIHQIKALHNKGNGLSERKIAKQLNISRNTVSKYLNMPETEITELLSDTDRSKKLDEYRDYIIQLLLSRLINTPRLTATGLRERLLAFQQNPERDNEPQAQQHTNDQVKQGNRSLAHYAALNGHPSGQGESHVIH